MTFNPAEYQVEQLKFFFLMFVRIFAMLVIFPVFGGRQVPWQLKVGLTFLLSLILFPLIPATTVVVPNDVLPFIIIAVKEVLVGLVIGFAASLLFTGVSMAGNIIDNQIGFTMVNTIDPVNYQATSIVGQFQVVIFTVIFLSIDGLHFLVQAIAKSFERIPIMGAHFNTGRLAEVFTYLTGNVLDIGVRLSAPVLIVVLLATVASGVLSRTMPQLNMFVVDMPLRVAAGLVGLAFALPVIYVVFEKVYLQLQENIFNLLLLMA